MTTALRAVAVILLVAATVPAFSDEAEPTVATHERAVAEARAAGDPAPLADALEALGRLLQRRGDFPGSIERLEEAVELRRRIGSTVAEIETRRHLGLALQRAGRFDDAAASYTEVLRFARADGDVTLEARMLANLGGIDWARGEPDAALDRYGRALDLYRSSDDRFGEAATLVNRGALRRGLGEIEDALLDYQRASELFDATDDRYWQARTQNNIGTAYLALGDLDRARGHLVRSLSLRREVGDRAGEAVTLRNLGTVYLRLGATGRARAAYRKALEVSLAREDRRGEASSRKLLGQVEITDGDAPAARAELARALDLVRAMGKRREEAESLEQLARAHLLDADVDAAETTARRSLELFTAVRDPLGEVEALEVLARVDRRRGRHVAARDRLADALGRLDAIEGRLGEPDRVAAFTASRRTIHELAIDTLLRLHRQDPERGHHLAALAISERARARALLTALGPGVDATAAGPALGDRLRRAERRLTGKTRRLLDLFDDSAGPDALRAAEQERFAALDDLENVRAEIRRLDPRPRRFETALDPAAIRALLDDGTVLIELFLGDEQSVLWWVTRDAITVHSLPPRREIEALATRAHRATSAAGRRAAEVRRAFDALGRALLAPVADRLRGQRLAIVADGALHLVPFAAVTSPRTGRPLLVDHELVGLPSASVLARHFREKPSRTADRSPRKLAILADPIVDADDPRIARRDAPAPVDHRDPLGRLVHSGAEAEAIAELAEPGETFLVLGADVRRDVVLGGALADAVVVHFATHGLFDPRAPELSGLVLSRFDLDGRPVDGFLDLHDLAGLDLDAELVVLSACRTALGEAIPGEGLVGPARALLYAGVPRVVSSLWPVRDRATRELMTRFYRGLFDGRSPTAALRAAQLDLRATRRYRDPHFWAAFTLQGDWGGPPISSSAPQVPSS